MNCLKVERNQTDKHNMGLDISNIYRLQWNRMRLEKVLKLNLNTEFLK